MQITGYSFDEIYQKLLINLLEIPQFRCSPRGQNINENLVTTLVLFDPRSRLLHNPKREMNNAFAVGEFLWYWDGKNDLETMVYYNKRMSQFSDDGKTLNSAYGRRLRGVYKKDHLSQWNVCKQTLKTDKDSRRAVLHINEPHDQAKANSYEGSNDVPCTMSLQFFIRDNKLHLHTLMRSNDIIWGLTYDLFSFTMLQECMFQELKSFYPGLELGYYYHTAGSMHIYGRHFELAREMINWYKSSENKGDYKQMNEVDIKELEKLIKEEELLRTNKISYINDTEYKSCCSWMSQELNLHRDKRNKENTK